MNKIQLPEARTFILAAYLPIVHIMSGYLLAHVFSCKLLFYIFIWPL